VRNLFREAERRQTIPQITLHPLLFEISGEPSAHSESRILYFLKGPSQDPLCWTHATKEQSQEDRKKKRKRDFFGGGTL
jgi:hypothetical protein